MSIHISVESIQGKKHKDIIEVIQLSPRNDPPGVEQANRAFRTRFRQAVTFGSHLRAEVAVYLQVLHLHTQWTKGSWWDVSHDLPFALRELHPLETDTISVTAGTC